jgi:methyl-accepting chemotaxis protein
MKNNDTKSSGNFAFFTLISGAAVCVAAIISLIVQIHLARVIPVDDAALHSFKNILLWGGIINIFLFITGFCILFFRGKVLSGKLASFTNLVRPLAKKDFPALLQIPSPGHDGNITEDENELIESLRSLGKLFESLKALIKRSADMGNILQDDGKERDAVFTHIGGLTDKIANQFFEIESTVDQGIESLGSIESYLTALSENSGKQTAILEKTENNLKRSADLSKTTSLQIQESAVKAETLRDEINSGEEQAEEANELVRNISREVEGISEMTAIINQISEQTNMLSMNAAIESAHAGQAGKGFAVVAEEIRKLAESTKENAERIHEEILSITKNTQGALKASESSFGTFNAVSIKASDLAKELSEISSSATESGSINAEISSLINETVQDSQRLRDRSADIIVHSHSFRASLEEIKSLSDITRAEIKEIHSGTSEVLNNIKNTQNRIISGLGEAEEISNIISETSKKNGDVITAGEKQSTHKIIPALPERPAQMASRGDIKPALIPFEKKIDDDEGYSDSKEIAVKQPPRTIF